MSTADSNANSHRPKGACTGANGGRYDTVYVKYRALLHRAHLHCRGGLEDYRTAQVYYAAAIGFFENNRQAHISTEELRSLVKNYGQLIELCFVPGQSDCGLALKYMKRFWARYRNYKQGSGMAETIVLCWVLFLKSIYAQLPEKLQKEVQELECEFKKHQISKN